MDDKQSDQQQPKQLTPEQLKCPYCGHDRRDNRVTRRIYVNGGIKEMAFCCQEAGDVYQMGCEG